MSFQESYNALKHHLHGKTRVDHARRHYSKRDVAFAALRCSPLWHELAHAIEDYLISKGALTEAGRGAVKIEYFPTAIEEAEYIGRSDHALPSKNPFIMSLSGHTRHRVFGKGGESIGPVKTYDLVMSVREDVPQNPELMRKVLEEFKPHVNARVTDPRMVLSRGSHTPKERELLEQVNNMLPENFQIALPPIPAVAR